ncbi:MAG TPA: TraI/MobA(P) family conjugative relaxase [Nitrosospira sp.]|nr:TraI/MobA(P) family conjugative relaxase [Nitrosospira sp.]
MIVKRITTKAAIPRIARLVKYVIAAQGQGLDPRNWTRTADYMLDSGTSNRGEKVGGVRVTNCNTDDPAAATTLIEATQAANTRSKTDKTYHLMFSFPLGEEPDLKTLHYIEDQLCERIGYANHHRISAVHIDTDYLHVHVAINKVHPTGYQNIEPYYDIKTLMLEADRLEIELGLQRTNHGLTGEVAKKDKARLKDKPAQIEAHANVESLTGYVIREVAQSMREAKDWQELHGILADHGLTIKLRGAGMVIGNGTIWAKASQCDRSFSMKALTDRLGPFEKPSTKKRAKPFEPRPQQRHPSSAFLYERYQRERAKHLASRKYALDYVKYEGALLEANLKKWHVAQRLSVKASGKGPKQRAMLKIVRLQTQATRQRNWKALDAKRRQIVAATSTPVWAQWLVQQAENGDDEALAVLRSRGEWTPQGNVVTAADPDIAKNTILHALRPHIEKDGSVAYGTADGGLVIDRKAHVQALRTTAGSTLLALELASKRFAGQALIVEGADEFKAEVARLAALHNIHAGPSRTRSKSQDKGMEL